MNTTETKVIAVKTWEAAKMLNVTPKTIRVLEAQGKLKANRETRHLLFPIVELERFLMQ